MNEVFYIWLWILIVICFTLFKLIFVTNITKMAKRCHFKFLLLSISWKCYTKTTWELKSNFRETKTDQGKTKMETQRTYFLKSFVTLSQHFLHNINSLVAFSFPSISVCFTHKFYSVNSNFFLFVVISVYLIFVCFFFLSWN